MSDDRLFSLNNPIRRKWYYINIIIISCLVYFTNFIFKSYIFPHITNEMYNSMTQFLLYFIYLTYLINFLGLIDRRLVDISGDRDTALYKNLSGILYFMAFYILAVFVTEYFSIRLPFDIHFLSEIAKPVSVLFAVLVILIGLFKGKISEK